LVGHIFPAGAWEIVQLLLLTGQPGRLCSHYSCWQFMYVL